jgi:hypothetical protein
VGVASAPTRIVGTAFSITTAERKKTSSTLRKRMSRTVARFLRAAHSASRRHTIAHNQASSGGAIAKTSESQMCLSNGRFYRARVRYSGAQGRLLTALSPCEADTNAAPGTRDSPLKKNFADFAESGLPMRATGAAASVDASRFARTAPLQASAGHREGPRRTWRKPDRCIEAQAEVPDRRGRGALPHAANLSGASSKATSRAIAIHEPCQTAP